MYKILLVINLFMFVACSTSTSSTDTLENEELFKRVRKTMDSTIKANTITDTIYSGDTIKIYMKGKWEK